jgi:hypothetical protein
MAFPGPLWVWTSLPTFARIKWMNWLRSCSRIFIPIPTVIHYQTLFNVDVFPLRDDDYSRLSLARRRFEQCLSFGPEPLECAVATAADTILRKLEWYRAGGETSERQWNDLRGVLKVSGPRLDLGYLRQWAPYLKVDDLPEQLLGE